MLQTLEAVWIVILFIATTSGILASRFKRTRFLWVVSIVAVCAGLGFSLYVFQILRL